MSKCEIDFSYLNDAIKSDEITRSKGKKKIDISEEKKIELLRRDVQILSENKIPLDIKGNQPNSLMFQIDNIEHLNELLNAMEKNNTFKGNLEIHSNKFTDNLGLKLAKIISNNSLRSLIIMNENKPFSDRVACIIGDSLENNTSLEQFICYLDIGEIAPVHLIKFLTNPKSRLRVLGHLKITKKLFETFSEYLNKGSRLNSLNFYYKPLDQVNLLYKKEIEQDVLDNLSNKIQTDSYVVDINVIPNPKEYQKDINEQLTKDINEIVETLKFSANIVRNKEKSKLDTDKKFIEQNKFIDNILEKIDREEGKSGQNKIVSVRTYLDRVIGESLNQALYDLEVQRERNPDKKELFTANGSIKFISQYLLDHKQ
jgi:hypothetical protein